MDVLWSSMLLSLNQPIYKWHDQYFQAVSSGVLEMWLYFFYNPSLSLSWVSFLLGGRKFTRLIPVLINYFRLGPFWDFFFPNDFSEIGSEKCSNQSCFVMARLDSASSYHRLPCFSPYLSCLPFVLPKICSR